MPKMSLPLALTNRPRTSHWSNANATWLTAERMIADLMIISGDSLSTSNIVDYKLKVKGILSKICLYYVNSFKPSKIFAKIYRKANGKRI